MIPSEPTIHAPRFMSVTLGEVFNDYLSVAARAARPR